MVMKWGQEDTTRASDQIMQNPFTHTNNMGLSTKDRRNH